MPDNIPFSKETSEAHHGMSSLTGMLNLVLWHAGSPLGYLGNLEAQSQQKLVFCSSFSIDVMSINHGVLGTKLRSNSSKWTDIFWSFVLGCWFSKNATILGKPITQNELWLSNRAHLVTASVKTNILSGWHPAKAPPFSLLDRGPYQTWYRLKFHDSACHFPVCTQTLEFE